MIYLYILWNQEKTKDNSFTKYIRSYPKYVEAILIIWHVTEELFPNIWDYVNNLYPSIKFTLEIQNERETLNFLVVSIIISNNFFAYEL